MCPSKVIWKLETEASIRLKSPEMFVVLSAALVFVIVRVHQASLEQLVHLGLRGRG